MNRWEHDTRTEAERQEREMFVEPRATGLHPHRFADNPEERRFADAWQRFAGRNLDYLLHGAQRENGPAPQAEPRDRIVATTVIQWLGSPVGQGFLRDLGYEKK